MTIMDLSLSQLSDEASHESSDSQDEAWAPGPGEDMTPLDAFVLGFTREEEEEDDLQEEEETGGGSWGKEEGPPEVCVTRAQAGQLDRGHAPRHR